MPVCACWWGTPALLFFCVFYAEVLSWCVCVCVPAFVIVIMLCECRDTVFSSSPSVWLQCRVTLIPLISARAQQGSRVVGGLGRDFTTPLLLGHTYLSACFFFYSSAFVSLSFSLYFLSYSLWLPHLFLLSF